MSEGPKPIHVALIGCGPEARRYHLPAIRDMGTAELIAVVDADAGSVQAAGELAPDAARYHDLDTVFERSPVDAVVIATGPAVRAALAVEALNRGLPVYVEPPLATSVAEGRLVETAWLGSSACGTTGLYFRFAAVFEELHDRIAEGEAGELHRIASVRSAMNCLDFDLLPWLVGDVIDDVEARDVGALVRLSSGLSCDLLPGGRHVVEVTGSSGKLVADVEAGTVRVFPERSWKAALREMDPRRWTRGPEPEAAYRSSLEAFVETVRSVEDTQPDIADGMLSLIVADAVRRSAAEGRVVRIEEYAEQEKQV